MLFRSGIYVLPILIAPEAPASADISSIQAMAAFKTTFRRDLKDSDPLHWGEGVVTLSPTNIAFVGKLAPGPDYKLYLVPEYVETKKDFLRVKASARRIGDIKTFENFAVAVPEGVKLEAFNAVLVWCETFSMFITSAKYR